MFSIYSHVRNHNRGRQTPDHDSDAQTPTPPPTMPTPKSFQSVMKTRPEQSSSLPTPASTEFHVDQMQNSVPKFSPFRPPLLSSSPALKAFPFTTSEPSEADEEDEAVEAPAIEELLTGSPNQSSRWTQEALKREPSPIQQPPTHYPVPPPSKKEQICNDHRPFLLGIKRSLRGRIISNAPIGDRSKRSTRYISPFTLDDLQELYNRSRRSPTRVTPASPSIRSSSESVSPPKRRQARTPEPRKRQQRSKSTSSQRQSVRNASVKKPERIGIAARRSTGILIIPSRSILLQHVLNFHNHRSHISNSKQISKYAPRPRISR